MEYISSSVRCFLIIYCSLGPVMQLHTLHLVLVFILTSSVQSSNGSSTLYVASSQCTLDYFQNANGSILFNNCSSPAFTDTAWSTCALQCCDRSVSQTYSSSATHYALRKCQQSGEEQGIRNLVLIVFSLSLGMCVLIIVIACVCSYCRGNRLRKVEMEEKVAQKGKIQWENEHAVNFQAGKATIWSANSQITEPLKRMNQPCSICIEDDPNTELFCGHQFHIKCIGGWLSKSSRCPCCRRQNIRGLKVYCTSCRWRYFVCGKIFANSKDVLSECEVCSSQKNFENNTLDCLRMVDEKMEIKINQSIQ